MIAVHAHHEPVSMVASAYADPQPVACGGSLSFTTPVIARAPHLYRRMPCGSRWVVSWRGRSVTVRVVDAGPFVAGRDIDLGPAAYRALCGCRSAYTWGVRRVMVRPARGG